jgi:hypothetical protein
VLEQVEGPDIREMMVFFCHSDTYYITYLVRTYQRRSIYRVSKKFSNILFGLSVVQANNILPRWNMEYVY